MIEAARDHWYRIDGDWRPGPALADLRRALLVEQMLREDREASATFRAELARRLGRVLSGVRR